MMNSIFTFTNKMSHKAKNHLYDNLEEQEIPDETEFTEADLVHHRQNSRASSRSPRKSEESDFIVSSPPRTKLPKDKEEKLNPYTNPYLDSDLGRTIGKASKKNRRQIDTDMFQIDRPKHVIDEENTSDTTREKSERQKFSTNQKKENRTSSRGGSRRARKPPPGTKMNQQSIDPEFD